jgi:hypothetical protein
MWGWQTPSTQGDWKGPEQAPVAVHFGQSASDLHERLHRPVAKPEGRQTNGARQTPPSTAASRSQKSEKVAGLLRSVTSPLLPLLLHPAKRAAARKITSDHRIKYIASRLR